MNGAHIVLYRNTDKSKITISSIRCSLQVALLGAVTENLRAVNILFNESLIELFFYYELERTEAEKELAEVAATEVMADFVDISVIVHKVVLPLSSIVPELGIRVFHRNEG
jgi:hypothetical protein